MEDPTQYIRFEDQVHLDHTSFIDGHIPATHVLIEQKSIAKDLGAPIRQSDGSLLNPFQQAKRYSAELPYDDRPRWIVTCNFREFWIYDMNQPNAEPTKVLLENLVKEHYLLAFLVKKQDEHLQREMELSMQAGELVGQIYDKLILQYRDPTHPESLRSLNQLCVRLVFLLFAEDAELFGDHNAFHDYMSAFPAHHWRRALIDLFRVLDTPVPERDPYLDEDLKGFPYVNGGLFSDSNIEIPQFTEELKQLILTKASADFDWSEISPTIFGGVFESTLNPETRRSGGMHYTSIENIHKVIDPLFMHQLEHDYEQCTTKRDLLTLQDKLASLTFFDPACGSGNFLTETYISLRRLENKIIARLQGGQAVIGEFVNPIKVDIHQFYGIEINDFAVSVATTALWIAELQMLRETRKVAHFSDTPLPLKTYHNIHEGNALRIDWAEVIAPERLNYIIGNPPFVGYALQTKTQKEDLALFMSDIGKNIDYVAGWYYKAAQMMTQSNTIRAAFVSTNSITQGEQVAAIWKPLFERYGIHFDFAYPTFRWDSESNLKAHVHCVIIGFSRSEEVNSSMKVVAATNSPILEGTATNSPAPLAGRGQGAGQNTPIPKTMNVSYLREQRRDLRTNGTSAEGALWNLLKAKQINGLQFRRQFSVENDILDFYCPKLRLAIELDGDYHFHGWQRDLDRQRDENLFLKYGIFVLRFENKIVFENPRAIVQSIMKYQEDCINSQSGTATNSPMHVGIATNSPASLAGRGQGAGNNTQQQGAGQMATQVSSAPTSTIAPPPNPLPASGAGELQRMPERRLYNADGTYKLCHNINGYLLDAPTIFVENRKHPLCNVPEMIKGSIPVDGGHLIIEADEYDDFIAKDPCSVKFIRRMVGSEEFINNRIRYCLWLVDASPAELRQCPEVIKRVAQVREMRLASTKEATKKYADFPTRFMEIRQPNSNYLLIPSHSSENRRYVPIGFMSPDVISGNANFLIPNATLYHFGVLTSNVHMAWMRAVCGRLEMRYRYSNTIVYNNFPWAIVPPQVSSSVSTNTSKQGDIVTSSPAPLAGRGQGAGYNTQQQGAGQMATQVSSAPTSTIAPPPNLDVHWTSLHPASGEGELQRGTTLNAKESALVAKIAETAQGILDARALYPDCSLADLYDEVTMPIELRRAHQANDRAVMQAYGFPIGMSESECVARLLEMYQAMVEK